MKMTGSCIREEGGVSCWHMQGHIHTRSQSSISQRLTVRPRHISAVKAAMCDYKKELPSSLIKFLYWADLETHTYDVCLYSCQWYEGKTGLQTQMCCFIYFSFVLLSPASPLKFDWCLVIYSFHLVCLLSISLSLSLSLCMCVSVII